MQWLKMALTVALFAGLTGMQAQQTVPMEKALPAPTSEMRQGPILFRTFHLTNVIQTAEANELLSALRNMLDPHAKVVLVSSQNAIVVQATAPDLEMVQKLLAELDRPKKTYRLTYTITEMDGSKRLGTQHFSMIVVAGQRTVLKQGSKIPIVTGKPVNDNAQFTYESIGMDFDVSLDEFANGVRLRSRVDETSAPEEKTSVVMPAPVIRQSSLEGTAFLAPGKPMVLGAMDVPGSTRHLDVEVVMEQAL